jgi:acyl-CoA synthetase (AMP-forming)/AMP-acid ligase II
MPAVRTLPAALAAAAHGEAGYIFLAPGGETRRSYADVYELSQRVASALCALGLRRGDLVALVIGDPEQFLTTLFGASVAGVIPASLYPPASTSDLPRYLAATAGILRSCHARAVVTTVGLQPHFDALRASCPELRFAVTCDALRAPASGPLPTVSADDIAFVQFTSGSTSAPKGVVVTHRNLSANIDAFSGPSGVASSPSDCAVSWLPMHHDMGLVGMAIGAVYSGLPAVLLTPQAFVRRPADWLRAISRYGGTISFAPNFAYDLAVRRIKERELEGLDLSCWRVAGCGAEPVHAPTLAAFAEKFRPVGFRETSFLPSYGLAEHVLAATCAPHGRAPRIEHLGADDVTGRGVATTVASSDAGQITVTSCGAAFPGHQVRIADEHGRSVPERGIGEIWLAGPSVTPGYYNDAELTARTIRDGWLHTGDLGYLSKGELFVCGRLKDIIIAHGRKYHPQDLEWGIADLAGIRPGRVAAFGTVTQGNTDRTVVVVEPSGTVPSDVLTTSIRRRIVDLCGLLIDDVVLAPAGAVVRTTSGKVRRAAIKLRYEQGDLEAAAEDRTGSYA